MGKRENNIWSLFPEICSFANISKFKLRYFWNMCTRNVCYNLKVYLLNYFVLLTFENIVSLRKDFDRFVDNVRKQVCADPLVAEILYSPFS